MAEVGNVTVRVDAVITDEHYRVAMGAVMAANECMDLLVAENVKLRELVRHMHTCMEHYEVDGTISCDRCPLDNNTGNCDFERRMSEMGVVK